MSDRPAQLKRLTKTVSTLRRALIGAGAGAILCGVAQAGDDIEINVSGQASFVAGVSDQLDGLDGAGDVNAEVKIEASSIFNSGLEIGAALEARLDGDEPAARFGGGRYSSFLIGGPRGVAPFRNDVYLQGAYAFAKGSFGQVIVGREQGAARSLAVISPTIFAAANINDWQTDLSGLNDVHTVNDFTGYATKVTYMPPANLLGGAIGSLRLGVSYSPSLRNCGESLCAPQGDFLLAPDGSLLTEASNWEDAVEAALYYQKPVKLGSDRLLIGLGASFVRADEDGLAALAVFDDYEAYSVGLNIGYRGITIGGSVKTTNAGLALEDDEDGYLAFDAGLTYRTGDESGDWGFMLGYGESDAVAYGPNPLDPTLFLDTQTAQAGVTYVLSRGITIGAAAQYVESTKPVAAGGPEEATTVVIESSINF